MMIDDQDRCLVGAYWHDRAETAGQAARSIAEFFGEARTLHPLLKDMVVVTDEQQRLPLTGISSSDALTIMAALNDPTRLYSDSSGARIPFGENAMYPSGSSTGLYPLAENYNYSGSMDFMMTIGSAHPSLGNAVVLTLPVGVAGSESWILEMQRLMVRYWVPDFAVVTSNSFREAVEDTESGNHIGWQTYLADFGGAPPLDVRMIEQAGNGAYIQLVEKPGANLEDEVRRAIKVRKQLLAAGILKSDY